MHKQGIQAALGCDSDVSQHEGNSSVHLHWVSGSVEQDADPGNVKTRDFQNLATGFGNSQDSGVLRCSEGKHFQRVNEEGPGLKAFPYCFVPDSYKDKGRHDRKRFDSKGLGLMPRFKQAPGRNYGGHNHIQ